MYLANHRVAINSIFLYPYELKKNKQNPSGKIKTKISLSIYIYIYIYSGRHNSRDPAVFGARRLRALKWHKPDLSIIISNKVMTF